MQIVVNGLNRTFEPPLSIEGLIEALDLGGSACAAEVNRELVPKKEHATRVLEDGDTVELVTLVGGG